MTEETKPTTAIAVRATPERERAPEPRAVVQHDDPIARMTFAEIMRMGDVLAPTGMLPQHIRNGAQAAAIIMAGRELGLPPMRSLRSIRLVKGNVSEDAASLLSRFKKDGGRSSFRHGACEYSQCKAPADENGLAMHLDAEHASLWLRHPNGDEHVETFTMADAEDAGLVSSSGMYQKYAKAMLRSRSITAGLKSLGWEGAANVYARGELPDDDDGEARPPAEAHLPVHAQRRASAEEPRMQRSEREPSGRTPVAPSTEVHVREHLGKLAGARDVEQCDRIISMWLNKARALRLPLDGWLVGLSAAEEVTRARCESRAPELSPEQAQARLDLYEQLGMPAPPLLTTVQR